MISWQSFVQISLKNHRLKAKFADYFLRNKLFSSAVSVWAKLWAKSNVFCTSRRGDMSPLIQEEEQRYNSMHVSPTELSWQKESAMVTNFADYFCYIHLFSAKLLKFINLKHMQKLEILYEFDIRFHTKVREPNLSYFTDCTKRASAGALTHRQQTVYWIFTKTKLSSI